LLHQRSATWLLLEFLARPLLEQLLNLQLDLVEPRKLRLDLEVLHIQMELTSYVH
jgi:hypothetical protein